MRSTTRSRRSARDATCRLRRIASGAAFKPRRRDCNGDEEKFAATRPQTMRVLKAVRRLKSVVASPVLLDRSLIPGNREKNSEQRRGALSKPQKTLSTKAFSIGTAFVEQGIF